MDGKKVVIIYVGIILLVVIAVVVAMQVFFAVYEPKETSKEILNFIQLSNLNDSIIKN